MKKKRAKILNKNKHKNENENENENEIANEVLNGNKSFMAEPVMTNR